MLGVWIALKGDYGMIIVEGMIRYYCMINCSQMVFFTGSLEAENNLLSAGHESP